MKKNKMENTIRIINKESLIEEMLSERRLEWDEGRNPKNLWGKRSYVEISESEWEEARRSKQKGARLMELE